MSMELAVVEETKDLRTGSSKDWLEPADSDAVLSESGQDVPLHGSGHGDAAGAGHWEVEAEALAAAPRGGAAIRPGPEALARPLQTQRFSLAARRAPLMRQIITSPLAASINFPFITFCLHGETGG